MKKPNQPKDQQEKWEELQNKLQYISDAGFELTDFETFDMLKSFIKDLLAQEYKKLYDELFIKCGKETEKAIAQKREQVIKEIDERMRWENSQGFNAISLEELRNFLTKLRDRKEL